MNKHPLSVTILGLIFIAAGTVGIAYHFSEFRLRHPFEYDIIWVTLVRLLAIVSGAYMLRGQNWARWLAIAWIAFHVVISAFHSWNEFAMHAVLLAVFTYILFRPPASKYFHNRLDLSSPPPR